MNEMDTLTSIVHFDPEIMHGIPVFRGTRVPVATLFDHLRAGDSLDDFLDGLPTVTREQAVGLLDWLKELTLQSVVNKVI